MSWAISANVLKNLFYSSYTSETKKCGIISLLPRVTQNLYQSPLPLLIPLQISRGASKPIWQM